MGKRVLNICKSFLITVFFIGSLLQYCSASYYFKTAYFDTKLGTTYYMSYNLLEINLKRPLDHFNFITTTTFKLRYLINDTYWSNNENAPIFLYAGNEGDITAFAQNTGFMWEIAPEFKALIVFAEHRYYGESLPFDDKSSDPKNLGYLSSSQALMDYVELIAYLKNSRKLNRDDHPVVAFGGSYGGMLAAWMRMKYPATIAGAIASSAPIWQFTGMTKCNAFNRVLTSTFNIASHTCRHNIRKSWDAINNITNTDGGKAWLSSEWKLCAPLKTSDDVISLKYYLNDMYANLAMADYPYPANFLAPLPANPVNVFCKFISKGNLDGKTLLTTLFSSISVYFNYTGASKCFDYSDAYTTLDSRLWDYQACSEMVMPMCADGKHDMFEPQEWNITSYGSTCLKSYGVEPQAFLVKNLYGGKDISTASNIIFSNGLLDPWSSGGVMQNVSETAVAVVIPESAHHLDLRASNPSDPASVTQARKYYRQVIKQWIGMDME